jgi:hypothetical protein
MLPASPDELEFANVQGFIWNRTRAVRQDFIVQGQSSPLTIECHERIARYHILCLHWKGGRGAEEWSEQQELEQLRKSESAARTALAASSDNSPQPCAV